MKFGQMVVSYESNTKNEVSTRNRDFWYFSEFISQTHMVRIYKKFGVEPYRFDWVIYNRVTF